MGGIERSELPGQSGDPTDRGSTERVDVDSHARCGQATSLDRLARRAQQGDRGAFAQVVEETLPSVRRFLFRLGTTAADLDDVSQEVFMTLIRQLPTFRGEARFLTWLFGIAVRMHRQRFVRRSGSLTVDPDYRDEPRDPSQGPLGMAEQNDELAELRRNLARLTPPLREAFVMRHVEELSSTDAAEALGIPEGTFRRRAHDAREQLREMATVTRSPQ